uniref:Uncharacterized protein n=1 Tax=Anguilla anguilla TaxID=7936 RepID=A0A0E9QC72_ANGAN
MYSLWDIIKHLTWNAVLFCTVFKGNLQPTPPLYPKNPDFSQTNSYY